VKIVSVYHKDPLSSGPKEISLEGVGVGGGNGEGGELAILIVSRILRSFPRGGKKTEPLFLGRSKGEGELTKFEPPGSKKKECGKGVKGRVTCPTLIFIADSQYGAEPETLGTGTRTDEMQKMRKPLHPKDCVMQDSKRTMSDRGGPRDR